MALITLIPAMVECLLGIRGELGVPSGLRRGVPIWYAEYRAWREEEPQGVGDL